MPTQTPAATDDTGLPVKKYQRDAYEETDCQLITMDGLLSALDVLEDELEITSHQVRAAKAFFVINRLMRETMVEIWETRKGEWASLGGKFASDDDKARAACMMPPIV